MIGASNLLEWVAETPFLIAFLVIAVPSAVISVFGILVIRLTYPPEERIHGSVGRAKVNYMAETYAVVLGLFLVTAFEMYQDMETTVNSEALSVRALHQLVQAWPEHENAELLEAIAGYANVVVDEEWPLLAFGDWSPQAQIYLDQIFREVGARALAETPGAQAGAVQAEQLARQIALSRADRLAGGPGERLSGMLSYVLVVLTLIAFALPWFVYTPYFIVHAVLGVTLVVVFISIIVFSVKMMYPFAGELAILPELLEAFRNTLLHPDGPGLPR